MDINRFVWEMESEATDFGLQCDSQYRLQELHIRVDEADRANEWIVEVRATFYFSSGDQYEAMRVFQRQFEHMLDEKLRQADDYGGFERMTLRYAVDCLPAEDHAP